MIELNSICKSYMSGGVLAPILKNISLFIGPGEYVSIMGPSGSGKSTLSSILGCLARPTSGNYRLNGHEITTLSDKYLALLRNRWVGFIFQDFNLLEGESAVENVALPLVYAGVSPRERRRRATAALESVDLGHRLEHTPRMLSGGQKQRVAIARALVSKPAFLFADEPTGALDKKTGAEILGLMQRLNMNGHTIVQVTHSAHDAQHSKRIISLVDGLVVKDTIVEKQLIGSFGEASGDLANDGRKRLWQIAAKLPQDAEQIHLMPLLELFRSTESPKVWAEIPRVLIHFDAAEAQQTLERLAGCKDWVVRAELVKSFSLVPLNTCVRRLACKALQDPNSWVRFLALTFWKTKPEARSDMEIRTLIVGMLRDMDERIRATVVATLGQWRDGDYINSLFEALNDSDGRVQANAIEGLRFQLSPDANNEKIVAAVMPFLQAPQNRARGNAVATLMTNRPQEAYATACEMVAQENNMMRASGAWALGEIGTAEAGMLLVRLLSNETEETVVQPMVASLARIARNHTLPLAEQINVLLGAHGGKAATLIDESLPAAS